MAKKATIARLACLNGGIFLVKDKQIEAYIELNEDEVYSTIDKIISEGKTNRPTEIFKKAIEIVTDSKFSFSRNNKPTELKNEDGKTEQFSIHDEQFFCKFRDYIMGNSTIINRTENLQMRKSAARQYKEKNFDYESYKMENKVRKRCFSQI